MTDKTMFNDNPTIRQRDTCCLAIPALVRPHIIPMLRSDAVARAMCITVDELHRRNEALDGPEPYVQFALYEMASVMFTLEDFRSGHIVPDLWPSVFGLPANTWP